MVIADGAVEGFDDVVAGEDVPERVHDRHRLRCREREIEARHPTLPGADLGAVRRQPGTGRESGEDSAEVVAGDVVGEVQQAGPGADPATLRLGTADVVVVETARDLA